MVFFAQYGVLRGFAVVTYTEYAFLSRLAGSANPCAAPAKNCGISRAPGMVHYPSFWHKLEVIKHPPLPDGRATPTRQGQYPEMGRLKEA